MGPLGWGRGVVDPEKHTTPHMGHQNLVWSPFTTSGQETDWVYSYNPGACTGLTHNRNKPITRQTLSNSGEHE